MMLLCVIMFYVMLHVINKYRYSVPYSPANVLVHKQLFNLTPSNTQLDSVLVNCPSYFTPDGLKLLFTRSFPTLLLDYDSATDFAGIINKHPLTNEIWMRVNSKSNPLGQIISATDSAIKTSNSLKQIITSKLK